MSSSSVAMFLLFILLSCFNYQAQAVSTTLKPLETFCYNETYLGNQNNFELRFRWRIDEPAHGDRVVTVLKDPEGKVLIDLEATHGDYADRLHEDGDYEFCFTSTVNKKMVIFWYVFLLHIFP